MKKTSERTWELVRQLYGASGFWDRIVGRNDPPLWAFAEIGNSGEPGVILSLLEFVIARRRDVQQAALNAIAQLVAFLEPTDYLFLDEQSRWYTECEYRPESPWAKLAPEMIGSLSGLPSGNLVVGFATFHRNGYVRQAAVKALALVQDGSEIPFLLIRLNDWVDPVREIAMEIAFEKTKPDYSRHFLRNLRLVDRLRACGRANAQFIDAVEALLTRPEAILLLKDGVASKDRWLRRQCFRMAVQSQSEQRFGFLLEILSDPDPILRLWSARKLLPELPEDRLRNTLPSLMRDPLMSVRCAALETFVKRIPDGAGAVLESALLDRNRSVRELARFHLSQLGWSSFDRFYIGNLESNSPVQRIAAICGLGETGNANHVSVLTPFLAVSSAGLQKAALKAIGALDGEKQIGIILSKLRSDYPSVSKAARLALEPFRQLLDHEGLWEMSVHDSRMHVRKNALLLLFGLTTWVRLKYIIMACAEPNPAIAELGRQHLTLWRQRSTRASPTDRDVDSLCKLLAKYERHLDPEFVRQMKFLIKTA